MKPHKLGARERVSHMLAEVARILSLTPEDRLREVANASRFIAAARRVRITKRARKRRKREKR